MGAAVQRRILLLGFAVLAVAGAWPAAGEAAPRARSRPIVAAGRIEADLRDGRPVQRSGVVVPERLMLNGIDTVTVPFRCRGCRFEKGIDASGVTFARTVDLAGAHFGGPAKFRGTTFSAPAVFGATPEQDVECGNPAWTGWEFVRRPDFSLAVFDDLASFDTASFKNGATFDDAQFRARADFGNACFQRSAGFRSGAFSRQARFTQAQFAQGGVFDAASFAEGATFLGSTFSGTPDSSAASFGGATSSGDLDFTFVRFTIVADKPVEPEERGDLVLFSYLVCTGSAFFRDAFFAAGYGVAMDHVHIADLVLDVDVAAQVDDEDNQRAVLELIESSAKDRGDLGVANDAHYQDEILASRHYHEPWRALDYVFYRGVAGYLVRPLRPILVLLTLVVLLALVRVAFSAARPGVEAHGRNRSRLRSGTRAAGSGGRNVLVNVLDTIALVGPRGGRGSGELPLGRRLEIFVYRVLVVCALLALANANPTLRQMVDSLF